MKRSALAHVSHCVFCVVSSLRMPSIAREAPDPKLDLRYPAHWGRAGHNSLYPYRPLAAFTDRLAEEERRRGAEADKRTRALKQDGRQVERSAGSAAWWRRGRRGHQ